MCREAKLISLQGVLKKKPICRPDSARQLPPNLCFELSTLKLSELEILKMGHEKSVTVKNNPDKLWCICRSGMHKLTLDPGNSQAETG